MKYQSDWPAARQRLSALWRGERQDRPCLAITAPNPAGRLPAPPPPATHEARWLDPAFVVASARRQIAGTWWGGEAVPGFLLMAGWIVCLGGQPRYSADTIWFEPRPVAFSQPSPFRQRADDPLLAQYRRVLLALCEAAGRDEFLIGQPLILPAHDLLSMHLGTETFLLAAMDHPDWLADAIQQGASDLLRVGDELRAEVRQRHDYWYGNAGWMPFWAPEPVLSTQSDVSCMLSPDHFERFVMPELALYGAAYGALWYHLDGRDAKQHLPRLLSLPYLRVVQYVPTPAEPPNGPAHLAMYRQIQAAGKIVHVQVPHHLVEATVRGLDPRLLLVQTHCPSRADGEALLAASHHWV